jgi:hypothetical protein
MKATNVTNIVNVIIPGMLEGMLKMLFFKALYPTIMLPQLYNASMIDLIPTKIPKEKVW